MQKMRKRRTLQQRLLGTSCLLIILPLLITSVFLYHYSCEAVLQTARTSLELSASQAGRMLRGELNAAYRTVSTVSEHLEIQNIQARCSLGSYNMREQLDDLDYIESFFMLLRANSSVSSVRMTVPDNLIYSGHSLFVKLSRDSSKPYRQFLEGEGAQTPFLFLSGLRRSPIFGQPDVPVISCIKPIHSIEDFRKILGLAIVDINLSGFQHILNETRSTDDTICTITDAKGNLIASLGDNLLDTRQVLQQRQTDGIYGWTLTYTRPLAPIIAAYNRNLALIVALLLSLSACTLLLGNRLYRSLILRMNKIVLSLHQVEKGALDSYLPVKCADEIGEIEESYNFMVTQLKDLMAERQQLSEKIAATEMDALMARIDPHFLYNTLNTLSWTALDYNAYNINKTLIALSDYYKTCLQNNRPEFPVRDEVRHAELYVQIHNMRYENAIRLETEIDAGALNLMMPNMVLQPLIENSILHGILEKPERAGTIRLKVTLTADKILFAISDDGVGMDAETQKALSAANPRPGSSYGICNIQERLKLKYGDAFSLEFQSGAQGGTQVFLTLPRTKQKTGAAALF